MPFDAKKISRTAIVILAIFILLFSFQNCGDVQLAKIETSSSVTCTDEANYTIESNYNGTNYVSFSIQSKGLLYPGPLIWRINDVEYSERNPQIHLGASPNCNVIFIEANIENACKEAVKITTTYLDPRCIVVEPTPIPTPTPTPPVIGPPVVTEPPLNLDECVDPAGWTRLTRGYVAWNTQFKTNFPDAPANLKDVKNVWMLDTTNFERRPHEFVSHPGPIPLRSLDRPWGDGFQASPVIFGRQYVALKFRSSATPGSGVSLHVNPTSFGMNGGGSAQLPVNTARFSMVVSKKCGDFKTSSAYIPPYQACAQSNLGGSANFIVATHPSSAPRVTEGLCLLEPNTDYYVNIIYAPLSANANPNPESQNLCCHTSSANVPCDLGTYCAVTVGSYNQIVHGQ